mgnify:CR=1 FL=1
MRAVYLKSHGQADSLLLGERPLPQPGPGQVRVAIAYAGFNHVDLYMRDSGAGITHELPLILGVDGAGTVDAVGDGVSQWQQGDKVVIYPAQSCGHCEFCRRGEQMLCLTCKIVGEHIDGCFAEYVCVDAAMLFPVADHVSLQTAAVLPTAYLTAWRMVMTQARVAVGETVLVHGIGGGVALASLQLARLAGARVIVTSGADDKLAQATKLGAEAMVNYRNDKVVEAVMDFTDGRGVDVVIDNVGDATWGSSLRSLRRGGKIVTCGATTGAHPSADLQRVFVRQLQIIGSTLGNQDEFRALLAAVAEGQIEPVIDRVFDFDMAEEALKFLGEARQCGKLLLKIN